MLSLKRVPLVTLLNAHLVVYPTPSNISNFWNFGLIAGMCLVTQIITGIALAMHYTPNIDLAFLSVEHIMRDVNYGWLLRYTHANGASMFFISMYIHMLRGLYYGSYVTPREFVWVIGVVIFLITILTAFLGYVLPWGQMSFWGATVITSLASVVPFIGDSILTFLWGGFSVDNPTLNRFFSLHYLFPFLIAGLAILHLGSVHIDGSNNPLGITSKTDKIGFFPYFVIKDLLAMVGFFTMFSLILFYSPNMLGDTDNYIPANPMVTPEHIVPEWYLLPFYAILRSIPNKLMGFIAMVAAIAILALIPFTTTNIVRSSMFRPIYKFLFWCITVDAVLLGWIGTCVPETPYIEIGQVCSIFYFIYFLVLLPCLSLLENALLRKSLT
jgi:quinol-cytochrome oxidoreductase complex cytochrome b subunit